MEVEALYSYCKATWLCQGGTKLSSQDSEKDDLWKWSALCYPSECKMHKLLLSPGLIAVHTDFKKQTYCPPIVIPDIVLHKDKCKHKQTNKYCSCEIFSFFFGGNSVSVGTIQSSKSLTFLGCFVAIMHVKCTMQWCPDITRPTTFKRKK